MVLLVASLFGCSGSPTVEIPKAECPDAEGPLIPLTMAVEETRFASDCGQQLFGEEPRTLAGYVSSTGCIAIAPEFAWARPFSDDGIAVVAVSEVTDDSEQQVWARTHRFGAIDRSGEWVVEPTWLKLGDFEDGVATGIRFDEAQDAQVGVFVGKDGSVLGEADCKSVMSPLSLMDCDIAGDDLVFRTVSLPLEKLRTLVSDTRYEELVAQGKQAFGDDHSSYRYEAVGHFVRPDGEVAFEGWYAVASSFVGGHACAGPASGGMGVIDTTGTFVVPAGEIEGCTVFEDGSATLRADGTSRLYDAAGETLLETAHHIEGPLVEGRIRVASAGEEGTFYGFVDASGELVVPVTLADAADFSDGLAAVRDEQDGAWRFIAPDGETPAVLADKTFVSGVSHQPGESWTSEPPRFEEGVAVGITSEEPLWVGYLKSNGEWARDPEPRGTGQTTRYRGAVCAHE